MRAALRLKQAVAALAAGVAHKSAAIEALGKDWPRSMARAPQSAAAARPFLVRYASLRISIRREAVRSKRSAPSPSG
jgi:hypothetical protein